MCIACQPDFLLSCDDAFVRPISVFTDGFEFHAEPDKASSRLPDDAAKRRALLASGRYWVWSITWHDLMAGPDSEIALVPLKVRDLLHKQLSILADNGTACPCALDAAGNGFRQLIAFLTRPGAIGWTNAAGQLALIPLTILAAKHAHGAQPAEMVNLHDAWRGGNVVAEMTATGGSGPWFHANNLAPGNDLMVMGHRDHVTAGAREQIIARLRLGDSSDERANAAYLERWRRWLGLSNLFQFIDAFQWFCVSEATVGTAPDLELGTAATEAADWSAVLNDLLPSLQPLAEQLAATGVPMPEAEVYLESAPDDCFAEIAWTCAKPAVCLLVGDQLSFRSLWEKSGWMVITSDEIQTKGTAWLKSLLAGCKETTQWQH